MIRVVVVDDHPVVREGLIAVLGDEPDFDVVGQAESGEGALAEAARLHPGVLVMDVRLPGISGIEACATLAARQPDVRVVILTSFPNEGVIARAFAAGARGFVLKTSEPTELRKAVRAAAENRRYTDQRVAPKLAAFATNGRQLKGPFDLTLQEMRVIERLPLGLSNAELGEQIGVTENTVKTHLKNAMYKLKAKDRAQAVAIAIREGLA